MLKFCIIGERSKIAREIVKRLPPSFIQVKEKDIDKENALKLLILATDSKKANSFILKYPNLKIIDLSSSQKMKSITSRKDHDLSRFVYGLDILNPDIHSHNISIPGCSPTGSLYALYPIKDVIKPEVFINVNFSKSAMRQSSKNNEEIKDNMILVKPLEHYHQKEIQHALENKLKINLAANIVDVPHGISVNIFAKVHDDTDAFTLINKYYENDYRIIVSQSMILPVKDFIETDKVFIFIKQNGPDLLINVCLDNLIAGGAYLAAETAKQLFLENYKAGV